MKQLSLNQFKAQEYRRLIRELKDHTLRMQCHRAGANDTTLGFLDALEEKNEEELHRLQVKLRLCLPVKEGSGLLSPADIAMAKQKPISALLRVPISKKVVCLFHDDKNASMHIYGSRYHCFSCQADGDVIDITMKMKNCSFTAAVRFLINQ